MLDMGIMDVDRFVGIGDWIGEDTVFDRLRLFGNSRVVCSNP